MATVLPRDKAGFVIAPALVAQIRTALGEETALYIAQLIDKEETVLERWKEQCRAAEMLLAERDNFKAIANRLGARVHTLEEQLKSAREWAQQLRAIL